LFYVQLSFYMSIIIIIIIISSSSSSNILGTPLMNQNSNQDEIKDRLKSGNGCYHSV
jgi:hypothetical protein